VEKRRITPRLNIRTTLAFANRATTCSTSGGRDWSFKVGHDGGVVMNPVPDVDELTWLFGSEPVSANTDDWREYWPYSTIRFSGKIDDYQLTCEIEPGADTVKLQVRRADAPLVDLDLRDVASLTVDRTPGDPPNEALRISFRHADRLSALHLRLKPSLWMVWRVES
jgi:hypothetical protein